MDRCRFDFVKVSWVSMRARALFSRLKSSLGGSAGIGSHVVRKPEAGNLARARETIARRDKELERLRRQLLKKDGELSRLREMRGVEARTEGVRPQNIVWVFGTAKTGSSWFGSLMADPEGYYAWREPNVGNLFGTHYYG